MYVFADEGDGRLQLLVHRRSASMHGGNLVSAPGGLVERDRCGRHGTDFAKGAKVTALAELREEAGIDLRGQELFEMSVDDECSYRGAGTHRNYGIILPQRIATPGPLPRHRWELTKNGMDGVGTPAGDDFHSWVEVGALLEMADLLWDCRKPLEDLLKIRSER